MPDQLESLVDNPASPEKPAAVVVNARGERYGCLAIIHRNLQIPAGVQPDQAFQLFERICYLIFNSIVIRQGLSSKRGIEIDNNLGTDYVNDRAFSHLIHLYRHTADGFFLE